MIVKKKFFTDNYYNILYFFLFPTFILGQAVFKLNLFLIIISSLILFKNKFFKINYNAQIFFFLTLFGYFFLNSLIVSPVYYSFNLRPLSLLIIVLLLFTTIKLLESKRLNLNKIYSLCFFFLIFVLLDTLYQIFNKRDFFGFEYYGGYQRYSGPFGDEFILGAFLSFYLFISFMIFFNSIKKNTLNNILTSLAFIFGAYIFLKSGERIAFFTFIIQIFIFLFLDKSYFDFKKKIIIIFSIIIILLTTLLFDKNIMKKYDHFFNLIFNYETMIDKNIEDKNRPINKISFLNTQTGAHFLTAVEIWKNHKIFGVGIKNFRNESNKSSYESIISHHRNKRSATHPHNYYLEILSETGIIGLILFLLFFLVLINQSYRAFYKSHPKNQLLLILIVVILSKLFPLKADPSIFSSSLGFLFWIIVIQILSINYINQNSEVE